MKYAVETKFTYGYENVWLNEDGALEIFENLLDAQAALDEHLEDLLEAFELGHLEDVTPKSGYRIVEVAE